MSKSLGNFYTLRDLVDKGHDPVAIRYALLSVPYRKQLNFTFDALEAAKSAVQRIRDFVRNLSEVTNDIDNPGIEEVLEETEKEFQAGLDDDLNVARSLAAVFELIKKGNKMLENKSLSEKDAQKIIGLLEKFDTVLDVLEEEKLDEGFVTYIEAKIEERANARKERNWELADQIRDELLEKGIVLEDKPEGTIWKKK
jgi:cysteinyl-tRNA synthetase